ncbi:MBOAT family O-acyltransferase [Pedobacter psychrodurus]|uniref:MBOAT family O-acyltransferase n=1 Tax=Pedobacter psychrodurus TaxID=2530456 RepID=UPI00293008A7|nr:MBOAT family O-acyltransferase [Pedobacter psychrodurus]
MLFNSLSFFLFFSTVLLLYYFLPKKYVWMMLLASSLFFYMCWKWEYIFLLFFPATIDFFVARQIETTDQQRRKKLFLCISIITNLGLLFYFKYFNFFLDSINTTSALFGGSALLNSAKILLPVGISFYTFQSISYTVEVYRGNMVAERNFGRFALFVSFFPQLVAGPINRPQVLLPQVNNLKPLEPGNLIIGARRILWGLFKKVVVADRLAFFVNLVYNNPESYHGLSILCATVFFAFQIYCDFSGYSDIAIGVAKMMGIDLMRNFNRPYFSSSIREFWSKWHISLSTWFRDYLYIPLGGNKVGMGRWIFNLFITFLVSGVWHGASLNFIIWGALHGLLISLESLNQRKKFFTFKLPLWLGTLWTFSVVCFAWIFFRANNLHDSFTIIKNLFDYGHSFIAEVRQSTGTDLYNFAVGFPLIFLLLIFEGFWGTQKVQYYFYAYRSVRFLSYLTLIMLIAMFGVLVSQSSFIYFQF